jgi:uncharacterized cupin superfamily protein
VRKVNICEITEIRKAKESRIGFRRPISEALGREPASTDLLKRHPFDVELLRVPPHSFPYRYHSHSGQFEYYQVIAGEGVVRRAGGETPVRVGNAFLFKPGEPLQVRNESESDLELLIVWCFIPNAKTPSFSRATQRQRLGC